MSTQEIIADYPELEDADITTCLLLAAQREHSLVTLLHNVVYH